MATRTRDKATQERLIGSVFVTSFGGKHTSRNRATNSPKKKKTRVNSYFLVPVRTSQKQAIELREKDMVEVVLLIVSL